ncbi:MAG: hypothetical protein R3E83_01295 [Burkholderiaceae bacterium]
MITGTFERLRALDLTRELVAVLTGHHHVGEDEVIRITAQGVQGLTGRADRFADHAHLMQGCGQLATHGRAVIDDQRTWLERANRTRGHRGTIGRRRQAEVILDEGIQRTQHFTRERLVDHVIATTATVTAAADAHHRAPVEHALQGLGEFRPAIRGHVHHRDVERMRTAVVGQPVAIRIVPGMAGDHLEHMLKARLQPKQCDPEFGTAVFTRIFDGRAGFETHQT